MKIKTPSMTALKLIATSAPSDGQLEYAKGIARAAMAKGEAALASYHSQAEVEDQAIELASALELQRAVRIVADVAALPVGGKGADMPTQFHAGFQLACDEIAERIRTEVHVLPGGLTLPVCGPLPSIRQPAAPSLLSPNGEKQGDGSSKLPVQDQENSRG